ncbi:MAG: hypothetical protein COX78_04505, partial [Candidatus Levybacteria bacterium CG_4_10_14_0_2_um_filter_35_8]
MELILDIIVFIIKTLIKIGDSVILAFYFIKRIISVSIFLFIKPFFLFSAKTQKNGKKIKLQLKRERVKFRFFYGQRVFKIKSIIYFFKKNIKGIVRKVVAKILKIKNFILIFFSQTKFVLTESTSTFAKKSLKNRKLKRIKKMASYSLPFVIKFKYFFIGSFFSLVFIFLPILVFLFLTNIPNPNELTSREIAQTTKIYDRNGILMYQIYANQNRTIISLSSIPRSLKNATVAIEDKDFYKNPGFDVMAIIRATIADLSGEPLQGGSTLTQQLIKSTLLTPEKSINRKIKEIILAFWAERIYSKNQILEMYLNQVPYGGTAWGVEAASEVYFNKNAKDLSLAESAFLAGLPRAPSIYTPYGEHPELWKKRQKEVLARMKDLKYITENQRRQAEKEDLIFQPLQTPIHAPH